jgi:hypothetical protein
MLMHRLLVGPQCDRVDVVVSGEGDVDSVHSEIDQKSSRFFFLAPSRVELL